MKEYPVQRAAVLKPKPDPDTLVFGKTFTDHMFIMDYTAGQGWHDGRIVPYGPLALEPSAMVLHYAQEVFEGLKAYRGPDGGVQLFRPMENVRRINSSCERMCIPPLPEEDALAAIEQLVRLEAGWVPSKPGTSLYIRPFIIATTPSLGVHAAHDYLFCIITCPVGAYYAEGINPVKIYVENEDVRAVKSCHHKEDNQTAYIFVWLFLRFFGLFRLGLFFYARTRAHRHRAYRASGIDCACHAFIRTGADCRGGSFFLPDNRHEVGFVHLI